MLGGGCDEDVEAVGLVFVAVVGVVLAIVVVGVVVVGDDGVLVDSCVSLWSSLSESSTLKECSCRKLLKAIERGYVRSLLSSTVRFSLSTAGSKTLMNASVG